MSSKLKLKTWLITGTVPTDSDTERQQFRVEAHTQNDAVLIAKREIPAIHNITVSRFVPDRRNYDAPLIGG